MSHRSPGRPGWKPPRAEVGISLEGDRCYLCDGERVVASPAMLAVRAADAKISDVGDEAVDRDGQKGFSVFRPFAQGQVTHVGFGSAILQALVRKSGKHSLLGCRALVTVAQDASPVACESIERTLSEAGCTATASIPTLLASRLGTHLPDQPTGSILILHLEVDRNELGWVSDTYMVDSQSRILSRDIPSLIRDHFFRHLQLKLRFDTILRLMEAHLNGTHCTETRVLSGLKTVNIPHAEVVRAVEPLLAELVHQMRQLVAEIPIRIFEEVLARSNLLTGIALPGLAERMESELGLGFRQGPRNAPVRGLAELLQDRKLRSQVAAWTPRPEPGRPPAAHSRSAAHFILTLSILLAIAYYPMVRVGEETPVDRVLNTIVVPTQTFWVGLRDHSRPDTRPVALDHEQKRRLQNLAAENRRLQGLLALREKLYPGGVDEELVFARVLAREGSGRLTHLTLDKGSQDGLDKGMVVSSAEGLVGVLTEVNERSSRARLFTNQPLTASIQDRGTWGVVVSPSEHALEMHYLDPNVPVETGDEVLTNGLDGVYPVGMLVGKVSELHPGDGPYGAVSLKLAVRFDRLWEVLVLSRP